MTTPRTVNIQSLFTSIFDLSEIIQNPGFSTRIRMTAVRATVLHSYIPVADNSFCQEIMDLLEELMQWLEACTPEVLEGADGPMHTFDAIIDKLDALVS